MSGIDLGQTEAGQPTVLVVDDDPRMLDLMYEMLAFVGYRAVVVSKPAEGLGLVFQRHFACAVIDVAMPGGGGAARARAINRGAPELPVIMMRALSYEELMARIGGVAASAVLCKPFLLRDLRQALADAV